MSLKYPLVVLSTADFNAAIWTNKQHIAIRLSETAPVWYIESLGLRQPTLSLADIKRAAKRLLFRAPAKNNTAVNVIDERNLKVLSPLVIPWHRYAIVRKLNKFLLWYSVGRKLPANYVLWSFSPITYGLEDRAEKTFYHSVDLLHAIPGVPTDALVAEERKLIAKADSVVVSSAGVRRHVENLGASPLLWENVADIEMFQASLGEVRERRAIFVGNLTPSKVDFSILTRLADEGVKIALAGPVNIDGTRASAVVEVLLKNPNIEYLGILSQNDMARELQKSWIGIIPYNINSYTEGVFPMKVYEYLASGLRVVSTPIPSLKEKSVHGLLLRNPDEFVDAVTMACNEDYSGPGGDYEANSWSRRVDQIIGLINGQDKTK